jgi:hypothetical protein
VKKPLSEKLRNINVQDIPMELPTDMTRCTMLYLMRNERRKVGDVCMKHQSVVVSIAISYLTGPEFKSHP